MYLLHFVPRLVLVSSAVVNVVVLKFSKMFFFTAHLFPAMSIETLMPLHLGFLFLEVHFGTT